MAPDLPLPDMLADVSVAVNGVPAPIRAPQYERLGEVTFRFLSNRTPNRHRCRLPLGLSAAVDATLVDVQPGVYSDFTLVPEQQPLTRDQAATIYASGQPCHESTRTGAAAADSPPSRRWKNTNHAGRYSCEVSSPVLRRTCGIYQLIFRYPSMCRPGCRSWW